jgi:hypothetical protein
MPQKQIGKLARTGSKFQNANRSGDRQSFQLLAITFHAVTEETENNARVYASNQGIVGKKIGDQILGPRFHATLNIELSLAAPNQGVRQRQVTLKNSHLVVRCPGMIGGVSLVILGLFVWAWI